MCDAAPVRVMKPASSSNIRLRPVNQFAPKEKREAFMILLKVLPLIRMAAAAMQTLTYSAAAIYTHSSEVHHDVCPFYTVAAVLNLVNVAMLCIEGFKHTP